MKYITSHSYNLSHKEIGLGLFLFLPASNDENVSWVLNGSNSSGSKNNLLPGLLQVDDVSS